MGQRNWSPGRPGGRALTALAREPDTGRTAPVRSEGVFTTGAATGGLRMTPAAPYMAACGPDVKYKENYF